MLDREICTISHVIHRQP